MSKVVSISVRKRISDKWMALAPEDRSYLLPFGADKERLRLEAATVTQMPLEGIDFGLPLPAPGDFPAISQPEESDPFALPRGEILEHVEAVAQGIGFSTERRSLPPGSNILIFDLFKSARQTEPVPRQG